MWLSTQWFGLLLFNYIFFLQSCNSYCLYRPHGSCRVYYCAGSPLALAPLERLFPIYFEGFCVFCLPPPPLRGQHMVLCHPRWQHTWVLTEFADALAEHSPTECPLNILTLTERPPDGMSIWTFCLLVSLTPVHNIHPPPFRVDNMSLVTSCPATWIETCCPSVTEPAKIVPFFHCMEGGE